MKSFTIVVAVLGMIRNALGNSGNENKAEHDRSGGQETTMATITAARSLVTCTTTYTQTWYSTSGCDISCSAGPACYADNAVYLKCGCDRMSAATETTTVCPTKSSCFQCTSGWGIATIAMPCSTTTTPTALTTH